MLLDDLHFSFRQVSRRVKVFQLILILISLTTLINAQSLNNNLDEKISIIQLREDFDMLRKTLETSQPGLYLYTSKDSLDKVFDTIRISINEPMTSIDFYRKLSPLNEFIRNLHTRFWPAENFQRAIETDMPRFPFDIYWQNGEMIILRNNSANEKIQSGSAITSINGENSEVIFQRLLNCRFRDGYNVTYPKLHLIRYFSLFYAIHIGTPKTFLIKLSTPDGADQEIEVVGLTSSEIKKNRLNRYNDKYGNYGEDWNAWVSKKEPAFLLTIQEDVATLIIRTFYHPIIEENGQGNFQKYFDKYFDEILKSKAKHLIVDLRDNLGGSDAIGMELLSHLYDSAFSYFKKRSSIVEPNMKYRKKENGYEIIGQGVWTGKAKPSKNVFDGMVYVLMNGYSISAAGEFIGHLKNINRAVFIGEEAGGNPVQFTGGQNLDITLPHSKVTANIPLHQHEMNVRLKNTGHGVLPDYEIHPDIKNVFDLKDVEMEFVLNLIKGKN